MNSQQIIYASEVEEFFWEDSNKPVEEGVPIGYEVSSSSDPLDSNYKIVLVLFSDIYYEAKEEI